MKHTILYTREEGLSITNAAICTFSAQTEDAQKTLETAVTQWVKNTPEGKQQYIQSSKDFNIGDLACCQDPRMFEKYGITNLKIQTLEPNSIHAFDKHLCDAEIKKA